MLALTETRDPSIWSTCQKYLLFYKCETNTGLTMSIKLSFFTLITVTYMCIMCHPLDNYIFH